MMVIVIVLGVLLSLKKMLTSLLEEGIMVTQEGLLLPPFEPCLRCTVVGVVEANRTPLRRAWCIALRVEWIIYNNTPPMAANQPRCANGPRWCTEVHGNHLIDDLRLAVRRRVEGRA
jgi:hypothetical protein